MLQAKTLDFLKELRLNNNKAWFEAKRAQFESAKEDFEELVNIVIERLSKADTEIANLTAKETTFRQYRDVRFSKDKTPYKINMGAYINRGGKKSPYGGYYFHCQPGDASMIGGGLWMPPANDLKKVRQEIDYCYDEFKSIVHAKPFRKYYNDLERGEFALSREPKGYEKDNPAIEYLKLKSFVVMHPLKDSELTAKDIADKVVEGFTALIPMVKFINRSLEG